jgi:hypothetical protein
VRTERSAAVGLVRMSSEGVDAPADFSSGSALFRASSDLCQMALSRARLRHQRLILTPEGAIARIFPKKSVAATRSVAASTHRTRRFSLAHPPNLTLPAHPERMAITRSPFCPSPPASPRGTRQPQPADPLHKGREQRAGHYHLRQLEDPLLGVRHHLGPDLD